MSESRHGQVNPCEHSLECDHCGGDAIVKTVNWFADGEGERCVTCGFPGSVRACDDIDDDGEYCPVYWNEVSDDPDARCNDPKCGECCLDCKEATGGQCRAHAQTECTCYEFHGGHQPGCPMGAQRLEAGR